MTNPFIPYGQLPDGSRGLPYNKTTSLPIASAIEIMSSLPNVASTDNFVGRCIFNTGDLNLYVFNNDPDNVWVPIKEGQVQVGAANPTDSELEGTLYYATTSKILFIRLGASWVGIAGEMGSGVIWRHYTGDGASSTYPSGSSQMPPVEYVQVFVNGVALRPGAVGVRDYYMIGNDVKLNATPANSATIAIRTLVVQTFPRNAKFFVRRTVANGVQTDFDAGAQLMEAGQAIVTLNGVVQQADIGLGNGTYDYKIISADNTVASLTASGTTVTLVSNANHGYTTGDETTVFGAAPSTYNAKSTVTVINPTTFTYQVPSAPASSPATGANIRFGPVKSNDIIRFFNSSGNTEAPANGLVVYIQSVENLLTSFN